jgi:tetratricopeptide (TPR) repeat protein
LNSTCIRLGRFEEAEQYIKKGLTINPSFYQLWESLYNTYSRAGNKEEEITNLIKEIEGIANKNQAIYDVLIHYYKDTDPAKSDMFYKKADELDKTTNDTRLKHRIVLKVGIDKFLELANDAFEKGRLTNGFGNSFFIYEYKDHPGFKVLVEKVRKGR